MAAGTEVGAALAVCVDKQPVVDLWAGHADAARTRPWGRDTIVNLFSVGKALTALCALRLVEAGRLDLDAPVARYWPEFAQAGKARVPVRYLRAKPTSRPSAPSRSRPCAPSPGHHAPCPARRPPPLEPQAQQAMRRSTPSAGFAGAISSRGEARRGGSGPLRVP